MIPVDLLVVGAGSGGCVVAGRASEDPSRTVLLLEAGPATFGGSDAPGLVAPSFFDAIGESDRIWPGLIVRRSALQEPRHYVRGRGIGGSSAINAMVAIPGLHADYDRWAELGATGWDWANVEPWFSRTALALNVGLDIEIGPLTRAIERVRPEWIERVALTRDGSGRRVSAADAYLRPAAARPNLVVRGETLVDRVLFDGIEARGVVLADGSEILARRVVLAAGAIHTPAILLRSGVDRPGVGRGLKDHAAVPITLRYAAGRAPSTSSLAVSAVGRFSSGGAPGDLQLLPMEHLGPDAPGFGMVMVALMQVRSSGSVRLADGDPSIDPVVEFAMLDDPEDLRRLRIGAEQVLELLASPAVAELATPIIPDLSDDGVLRGLGDYVHAACSCRMGAADDPAAVVDPNGAVIGREGLYIADASIFPDLPRANTHLPVVAVVERLCAVGDLLRTRP